MNISTLQEDLLGLQEFAEKLEKFLKIEHRYVTESLVISLNAPFGAGKSTFLKMWMDRIAKNKTMGAGTLVVEINAWSDDYCGDPFVSLVSGLVDSLDQDNPDTKALCEAAKDAGWFLTGIGNQVVKKITGVDIVSAGELAEKKKAVREEYGAISGNYFSIHKAKKKALQAVKDSIRKLINGDTDNPSILILVDELDRCRPDYAISYLETIKHIFDIHGIVFVLAVDRKQLECTAKSAFGGDLDFPEYYRKFVQREITLQEPRSIAYDTLVSKYIQHYLKKENERYCYMRIDEHLTDRIVELARSMKMTPRQVQEVFRVMGHALETDQSKEGKMLWCLGVGTLLMSVLRIGNPDIYAALGRHNLGVQEAVGFFKELGLKDVEWWFTLCLTGGGLSEKTKDKTSTDIYREAGLLNEGETQVRFDFNRWVSGWGYSSNGRFREIHSILEQVSSWR